MKKSNVTAGYALGRRCNASIKQYLAAAFAENTVRAYRSDVARFIAWGGKIPCSPHLVARYIAHHAPLLSSTTLTRRLSAIAWAHTSKGLPSPTHSLLVKATLKGIRRSCTRRVRQVAALDKTHIVQMARGCTGLRGIRDRALLLVGFAGALRRSELTGINVDDIEFFAEGLVLHLRRSKTDQEGQGREVAIPRIRGKFCPCRCLSEWLAAAGIQEGAVFRSINQFDQASSQRLSGQSVALIIKRHAQRIGLDPEIFSGHSLRAGFVTAAAQCGVATSTIRNQTGHKSDAMVQHYMRTVRQFSDNANKRIW